jgi:hypothetical protein
MHIAQLTEFGKTNRNCVPNGPAIILFRKTKTLSMGLRGGNTSQESCLHDCASISRLSCIRTILVTWYAVDLVYRGYTPV